jgi:bifunctional non-homologous end joining protein LigD
VPKLITRFITPCAPTLRRTPPVGPEWVHEIKWDGWRLQAHRTGSSVLLYSRPGNDLTKRFPAIAEAVAAPPGGDLILDGELVAFDHVNRPDFYLLRRRRPTTVAWLFDLLHVGDDDLRDLPWTRRRARLKQLMAHNKSDALHLNDI